MKTLQKISKHKKLEWYNTINQHLDVCRTVCLITANTHFSQINIKQSPGYVIFYAPKQPNKFKRTEII